MRQRSLEPEPWGPACWASGQVSPAAGKDRPSCVFFEEKHTHIWSCAFKATL